MTAPLRAEDPLSAIDWLSKSVAEPATPVALPVPKQAAPVEGTITVRPIQGPGLDGIGLQPPGRSGLPRTFWGPTPAADVARLIRQERPDVLPALRTLLTTILLAELDPPPEGDGSGEVFLARVDKFLEMGALDPALALLELPDPQTAETFRRRFDVALLKGQEDDACRIMRDAPQIAPSFPARIFCLARGGDWSAAALSLRTGESLGFMTAEESALMSRFLDPELFEGEPDLPAPDPVTPLEFRLMEAIGQPLSTSGLPVAFAQADLRSNAGWKTRIEAGERLARLGSISANLLLGLYTEREQAASGGVWDRVAAIRALDQALAASDIDAVAQALPPAWTQMAAIELEVPFATLYGAELARLGLTGDAGALAFRVGLLSDAYETVARTRATADGIEAFLIGLAKGKVDGLAPPDQLGGAIRTAFTGAAELPADRQHLLDEGRLGEAVLSAIDDVEQGAKGDLRRVTWALTLLREAGFETVARRTALELLLLERRG